MRNTLKPVRVKRLVPIKPHSLTGTPVNSAPHSCRPSLRPSFSSAVLPPQHQQPSFTSGTSRLRCRLKTVKTASLVHGSSLRLRPSASSQKFSHSSPVKPQAIRPEWKEGEVLGRGSEGTVFKALNVQAGTLFAVKKFVGLPAEAQSRLQHEVQLLNRFNHPNIVRYLGSEMTAESFCLFLEFMAGGSVKVLIDRVGPLPVPMVKLYTQQALAGLRFLHRHGVIHRDIKAANLLLTDDGQLKLSDFGCAKAYKNPTESGFVQTIKGSLAWTAPEVVKQQGYGRKSDVWSLGCVVLEMLSGAIPWQDTQDYIALLIKLAKSEELPPVPEQLPADAKDFILQCLNREYTLRPSIRQMLKHPFIASQEQ